ncbi:MAG: hypothetical protein Tsb0014_14140 [Pleurocapsa sp.]
MEQRSPGYGAKVGTTAIIWAFATAMLAISIPLVSISHSGVILPLAIVFGVTLCTNIIWKEDVTGRS